MAEIVILEEQDLTFSDIGNGLYLWQNVPSVISLTEGETYTVVWDGSQHSCTATLATFNGVDGLGLGNFALAGIGENTNEPFLIGVDVEGSSSACYTTDGSESHTVAIYQGEDEKEEENTHKSPDIVLKNRDGSDVAYPNVRVLKVRTTDGGTQEFVAGEALENIPIALDFSEGDQTITAPDGTFVLSAVLQKPETLVPENIVKDVDIAGVVGTTLIPQGEELTIAPDFSNGNIVVTPNDGYMYSEVTVEKPSALIPENIAEGVDIAGIIGTLAAGGGGGAKIATGTWGGMDVTTEQTSATVTHGLGVIPDLVFVGVGNNLKTTYIMFACGISAAFKAVSNYSGFGVWWAGNGIGGGKNHTIDTATNGPSIFNANETTFSFGSSTYKLPAYITYRWFAIAGLS